MAKAASGTGSIRKKTINRNGKKYVIWEGRYSVGGDEGLHKQKSVYGKTQKEVSQKLKAITAKIDAGTFSEPSKIKLANWLDIWVEDYLIKNKPLTVANYKIAIENHIKPALGNVTLEKLKAHSIQKFYNSLISEGLSPKTIKNIHGILHTALEQAVRNGSIASNPADNCVLPKIVKKEIMPLSTDQIGRYLKAAQDDDYKNLFTVALFSGMRQGELLGLTWDCVDFANGIIEVSRQLQMVDGTYQFITPKSGKGRTLMPAPLVMNALAEQKQWQQEQADDDSRIFSNPMNLVFTDESGKNLVRRTVDKHHKKILEKAGLPDIRFHDLRHTFAVSSLQAGDDIKTVQSNLGHATAAFTMDVYAHAIDEMKRDSASRMQAFFEQKIEKK